MNAAPCAPVFFAISGKVTRLRQRNGGEFVPAFTLPGVKRVIVRCNCCDWERFHLRQLSVQTGAVPSNLVEVAPNSYFPVDDAVDKVHVQPAPDGIGQQVILALLVFLQVEGA